MTSKHAARTTPHARHAHLTVAEGDFLNHMGRWGSDGYPVQKMGRKWWWVEAFGVTGCPAPFHTKSEAFQAIDTYLGLLADKLAGRL